MDAKAIQGDKMLKFGRIRELQPSPKSLLCDEQNEYKKVAEVLVFEQSVR
jgi:hypothetical protein